MDRGKPLKILVVDRSPRSMCAADAALAATAATAAIPAALAAHAFALAAFRAPHHPSRDPALDHLSSAW